NYTDGNNCTNSDTINISVISCLGLKEDIQNDFSIYPNPFTEHFTVDGLSENTRIELYDISEKILGNWIRTNKPTTIYLNNLKSGIYLIRISDSNYSQAKRIIKK